MNARRLLTAVLAATLVTTALSACGGDDPEDDASGSITVWSLENQTDRVQATQKIADQFTAATGIQVKIVATDENQFTSLITSAAASGQMPDVVGALPLAAVSQMATNDLLDTDAAKAVVDELGRGTFSPRALELTGQDGNQLAVPSDGWAQLLFYRKDLFDKAGLQPPDTFDKIRAAAQRLNTGGVAGITLATVPNDAFTEQTFENFALGNGCELVDDAKNVTLDTPQCVATFQLYEDLVKNWSVPGAQDVDTTRATYFAGKAAMVVWSSFLLDEMAGLRNDALPTCPECKADPAYLAKNSGIVTAVAGPNGQPAQFGEITSWAITKDGPSTDQARKFVAYMMNEGYPGWLGIAPEGKFPVRKGDSADPAKFATAWNTLPAGVDTRKPLSDSYPADVLEALRTSPDTFKRWALPQKQGALLGATLGELPVPKAVNALAGGELDAAGAAKRAAEDVRAIQKSLN
ncbi:bicyclomycin resistance protein [Asanoa ishikariensis]|uniref:Carbohydrate ABC transporter substrate-binding protein, CUT1 family n=1 Tax=Asanoa ishikariensis TaxID=137265 RepID=A0A1H3TX25_9ACTN|nr:extracellular solute-binding protein [Asanoa ishikariensis]GIF67614.1 bicyclomycin resistance protein [Asanoa ishikariensis]SDZ54627.1 carbohydrate ABC transporter substrate-binding protein, CUT1 family [Asanoa ishikariensis]